MEIRKEKKDSALSMAIEGRIDTTTAPQLETELKADLDGVTELRLDFGRVEYISLKPIHEESVSSTARAAVRAEADEPSGQNGAHPCERVGDGDL